MVGWESPWHLVRMGHCRKNATWCAMWRRHHEASQAQRKCVNNMGLTSGKLQVAWDLQVHTCHGPNTLNREWPSQLPTRCFIIEILWTVHLRQMQQYGIIIENRDRPQAWEKTALSLTMAHVNFGCPSNNWTYTCFGMHLLFQMCSQRCARKTGWH